MNKLKLSVKKNLFTVALAKLILKAEELGFHPVIDETKRCKDCPNTIKNSCHTVGLAADINLYLGVNRVYYDGKDRTIENPHIALHDYWDLLGGSKRLEYDMNHYSFEHNGFR